jgi:hypothetical protein
LAAAVAVPAVEGVEITGVDAADVWADVLLASSDEHKGACVAGAPSVVAGDDCMCSWCAIFFSLFRQPYFFFTGLSKKHLLGSMIL